MKKFTPWMLPDFVASQITAHSTLPLEMRHDECWYVAGPMRGYEDFNFPAFDRARDLLLSRGYRVISPADMDRARGFSGDGEWMPDDFSLAMKMDLLAIILFCDGLYLLKGWSESVGARYEVMVARATGKLLWFADDAEHSELSIGWTADDVNTDRRVA